MFLRLNCNKIWNCGCKYIATVFVNFVSFSYHNNFDSTLSCMQPVCIINLFTFVLSGTSFFVPSLGVLFSHANIIMYKNTPTMTVGGGWLAVYIKRWLTANHRIRRILLRGHYPFMGNWASRSLSQANGKGQRTNARGKGLAPKHGRR